MKYALVSDIHGNRHALEAVWARLEGEEPDQIICGGDIVGYGAFPAECVQWVREHCDISVRGNHDHHVVQISGRFIDIKLYFICPDQSKFLAFVCYLECSSQILVI